MIVSSKAREMEMIEARHDGTLNPLPWLVYINGEMLKTKRGNGRRFATKEAAEKAAHL